MIWINKDKKNLNGVRLKTKKFIHKKDKKILNPKRLK